MKFAEAAVKVCYAWMMTFKRCPSRFLQSCHNCKDYVSLQETVMCREQFHVSA